MQVQVVHETRTRLRMKLPSRAAVSGARVPLELMAGVANARASERARSLVVTYDGRASTRRALLDLLAALPEQRPGAEDLPERHGEALPLAASAVATALTPLLPPVLRPPAALGLVVGHALAEWREGTDPMATALDGIAMAMNAMTGHPATATLSVLLAGVAERRRGHMLAQTDSLLGHLAPPSAPTVEVQRDGLAVPVALADVQVGDEVLLREGAIVPADGIVVAGRVDVTTAPLSAVPIESAEIGQRLAAGARIVNGESALRVERSVERSRAERLRAHVRHALRLRDTPGALTPDLDRVIALPFTAAGLVLGLTGDAARTAQMLQADPQAGISLAQPLAREAALYVLARHGALLSGLESIDRLASATTVAFEDVGVLADAYWRIDRIDLASSDTTEGDVRRWLARLAGHDRPALLEAGLADEQVVRWRAHGVVLHEPPRVLHVGGAALIERVWKLSLPEPDRRALVRRLGVVHEGRLLATLHLGCRLRPHVAAHLAHLRRSGVRRIAVFCEDAGAQPAAALEAIGADAVVCASRLAQRDWLADVMARGERVVLVHTGLRDLLPPGGLSLCPVDADAGAHGVLLGEPLPSLLAARQLSRRIRRELRWRFGRSMTANAALMMTSALQWLPPWSTAALKYASALLLLEQSARLALLRTPLPQPVSTSTTDED
jgi:cation transport ATPase